LARFHGKDWVAFCSAMTSLVPDGTSVLAAIFTVSIALSASSSESPHALARSEIARSAEYFHMFMSFVRCRSRHGSDLLLLGNTEFGQQTPSERGEFV
jgi:hypothetical protein